MGERIIKSENRAFKGIWIPRDLWLNPKLSVMEMLFLAEIDSLEQDEQGCFASNNHFAEFFGVSRSRSSQIITGLIKKGFVTATYDRAETKQITKRHLWVVNKLTTPSKFIKQGYLENCEGSNTSYSNTKVIQKIMHFCQRQVVQRSKIILINFGNFIQRKRAKQKHF